MLSRHKQTSSQGKKEREKKLMKLKITLDGFFMFRHLDLCIFKWQREGHSFFLSLYNNVSIVAIRSPDLF
jgi:hypothetical protein